MAGAHDAAPKSRRSILALGLCLLAFLFAVEAKLACYGPPQGPGSDVRAAKALPADIPTIVPHGLPAPDQVHPLVPVAQLLAFAACAQAAIVVLKSEPLHPHLSFTSASFFSPPNFFRPPPVR